MTISQSLEESHGSGGTSGKVRPRAMIHKRILEYAREHPDASIEDIAEEVSGTSPSFVERVFETYGDPANDDRPASPDDDPNQPPDEPTATSERNDTAPDAAISSTDRSVSSDGQQTHTDGGSKMESTQDDGDGYVVTVDGESVQLSERQFETLRTVAAEPSATQAEIADALNVSRATISKRLKDVDQFEWGTRKAFVEQAFGDGEGSTESVTMELREDSPDGESVSDSDKQAGMIAELAARVDVLESHLGPEATASNGLEDPELLHKVIHASMDAEYISEDEELQLLRSLLAEESTEE